MKIELKIINDGITNNPNLTLFKIKLTKSF